MYKMITFAQTIFRQVGAKKDHLVSEELDFEEDLEGNLIKEETERMVLRDEKIWRRAYSRGS